MPSRTCDLAIIGGGIAGTALAYLCGRYLPGARVVLLEKYPQLAGVNSHGRNNSQTLHCGDIETNYSLAKARAVRRAADLVVRYCSTRAEGDGILHRYPKMVIGAGARECDYLERRYTEFAPHFPYLQRFDHKAVARLEPAVAAGRRGPLLALGAENDYSAVDFQRLALSLAGEAGRGGVEILTNTPVQAVETAGAAYRLRLAAGDVHAGAVVVCAGAHSLYLARRMGHGREYACLPVAGSFYYAPRCLNGKVYTIQDPELPFAAVHGDPDLLMPNKTRFGPTAVVLPLLERHRWSTLRDFLTVFSLDRDVLAVLGDLLRSPARRRYLLKNLLFEVPGLRGPLFCAGARKIVPRLRPADLCFARGIGGIRPVMIDRRRRRLLLGEARLTPQPGLVFNMTPSPGATACLANGVKDLADVAAHLGLAPDAARLAEELGAELPNPVPGH